MNVTKKKLAFVVACALALAAAASSPGPVGNSARAEGVPQIPEAAMVGLFVVTTRKDGPTAQAGGVGTRVAIGQTDTVSVTAGNFDENGRPSAGLCLGSVSDSAPARYQPANALHIWRAKFRVVSVTMESIVVTVDWSRDTASRPGVFKREAGDVRTLTLREGEFHTIDFLTAPEPDEQCGANLRIDVLAGVSEDQKLSKRRICYDLWLLDEMPGREPLTRHFETVARHGDEIKFSFAPLRWSVPGAKLADGSGVEAIGEIDGTIRGRMREDGTIDVALDATRWLGAERTGADRTGGVGEGGKKAVRLTPGETLALVLPSPRGSHGVLDRDTRGLAKKAETRGAAFEVVKVDFSRVLADHTMSLRLRARPEQP